MRDNISDLFEDPPEFRSADFAGAASPDDLFSLLETLEDSRKEVPPFNPFEKAAASAVPQKPLLSSVRRHETTDDAEEANDPARKKHKASAAEAAAQESEAAVAAAQDGGQHKMSHITVERNRRKQMNEHLTVLRSLMPCFYVKRGDQASIIGGVVDYIKELQQVLQSLEAKKQRKVYSEVLSPRPAISSPRPSVSPRPLPPPLSPRVGLPISPRTPQPGSPYKPRIVQQGLYLPATMMLPSMESSPSSEHTLADLAANSKSPVAEVEVKFTGPNVLLKTVSHRIPGQAVKIIAALESLALEVLHVNISTIDDTMLNSFTIKVIKCYSMNYCIYIPYIFFLLLQYIKFVA
ncbi:transcription factor SPEECHLESS isoform X1 [Ananas comosus]|uniref:Transcription factor SPEECHLESS isoform X1 n=1 Tax=Ananas comosus TaxID=4615 RepID=A0A6P5EX07_ANACO|nr:transcription factor SPEECHLESS isoform X1 [Ananas comosus]